MFPLLKYFKGANRQTGPHSAQPRVLPTDQSRGQSLAQVNMLYYISESANSRVLSF